MTSIISYSASPNRGWTHGVTSVEKSSFTTPAGDVYEVQEVVYKVGRKVERGKITFANGDV